MPSSETWHDKLSMPDDHILLQDEMGDITYGQMRESVDLLAQWLLNQQAAVVGLLANNQRDWVITDLACQQAEVTCLPVPEFFSAEQLQHCLTAVDLLLSTPLERSPDERFSPLHDPVPGVQLSAWRQQIDHSQNRSDTDLPIGTGKVTFTSGSTGHPKGVCLTTRHQWQVAESLAGAIDVNQPRHLCLLPLATLLENIAGIYAPMLRGGQILLPSARSRGLSGSSGLDIPQLLDCIQRNQPDTLILFPQLLRALVVAIEFGWQPPASLKFVAVGGGKVAAELLAQARQLGLPVFEGYGLSECASVVALNTPAADRPGLVGKPLPHCQVTVDANEIVVHGSVFLGYMGQPDSWYPDRVRTGDLGALEDDWLAIHGRRKNLIISSFGRNINPEWVESSLLAQPILRHCVVAGEGRPYLVAIVGLIDGVSEDDLQHWFSHVNQTLPDYAHIQRWLVLPQSQWQHYLTANGRPQRTMLLRDYDTDIDELYDETHSIALNTGM